MSIRYEANMADFAKIPNYTIAYWISNNLLDTFSKGTRFDSFGEPKSGVMTGDDGKFIRYWYEINNKTFGLGMRNYEDMINSHKKWFPVTRGGEYRKWYGNIAEVVDLENGGYQIKHNGKNYRLRDPQYYFKEGITWTMISSNSLSVRLVEKGILFGNGGPTTFATEHLMYLLALLNSKIANAYTKIFNPTINTVISDICAIPVIIDKEEEISNICCSVTNGSKLDWNAFETSWNFTKHPLV